MELYCRTFSTLKGELLPYIISKQYFKPKQSIDDKNTSMVQVDLKQDIFRFVNKKLQDNSIRKWTAFNDHNNDLEEAYHGHVIRCYAYVSNKNIGLRANTVQMYHLANAKVEYTIHYKLLLERKFCICIINTSII